MELDSHYNHLSKPLLLCLAMLLTLTSTISLSLSFSSPHVAEGYPSIKIMQIALISYYLNVNDANNDSKILDFPKQTIIVIQQNNTAAVSIVENESNFTKCNFQSINSIILNIFLSSANYASNSNYLINNCFLLIVNFCIILKIDHIY